METPKDKNWQIHIGFKDIAKATGQLIVQALARPHILASHGNHLFERNHQPTLREQIHAAFEEVETEQRDMGDDLFSRTYRPIEVTPEHVEAIINDVEVYGAG